MSIKLQRAYGCLMGQAVGDALGTTYEFSKAENITMEKHDGLVIISGNGPFKLKPGQITDDTEMALSLARSIVNEGKYDRDKVALAYINWFQSIPFDIGRSTRNSLQGAKDFRDLVLNSETMNKNSLSNGCLMRISPLAIYGLTMDDDRLNQCCIEDCKMTHSHPIAIDAVRVYVFAIRDAILGYDKKEIMRRADMNSRTESLREIIKNSEITPFPDMVDPRTGEPVKNVRNDGRSIGYLGIALQNVFYELRNGVDFYNSLIRVIKRGGDTDTNGAICGSILGAYYSIDSIPTYWQETVLTGSCENRLKQFPIADTSDLIELVNKLYELRK